MSKLVHGGSIMTIGAQRSHFVKFTGPVKTVTANAAKLDELLNSVHK